MTEDKAEPLEGFQITDFDENTGSVEIKIHRYILKNENQREALVKKAIEIIDGGPNVREVRFTVRD